MADCLYLTDGELYLPTELVRGPWDPNSQHGGAPAALIVDRLSKLQPGGRLTRVTIELMRPVPLAPLTLTTSVEKSGRMVQRTLAELYADGIAVARAEGLHLAATIKDGTAPDEALMRRGPFEVMPGLDEAREQRRPTRVKQTSFSTHAVDIRFVAGRFSEPGPAAAWFRLKVPVVDDEPIHPWSRVAAAADFCNGSVRCLIGQSSYSPTPIWCWAYRGKPTVNGWASMLQRMRQQTGWLSRKVRSSTRTAASAPRCSHS